MAHGLQLKEMSASDMVDVIHYFFEEDMNVTTPEQAEARSKTREHLYATMYNTTYKYAYQSKSNSATEFIDPDTVPTEDGPGLDDIKPFNPKEQPTKAYVAPTEFNPDAANPFMGTLDAPMK